MPPPLANLPTITQLQTDRARLSALDLEQDLSEAIAKSRRKTDLVAAGLAVRATLEAALSRLPNELLRALCEEADETVVHYRLSDAIHQALEQIGRSAEGAAARALPDFGERFRRGARPRDLLTVSQWADRYRWITSGTNAPGPWRTSLTPYLRDVMNDLSEHSPVRTVVLCKPSGIGGTEALYNWIGYVMGHLRNRDMLHVSSTLELRDRSFNPRLGKMLRETPVLCDLIDASARGATRNSAQRADVLEYSPTARLIKAGANSPDSLSSDHIPYVALDEVDRYPWDVGGEGDPLTLISNRQRNFTRAKTFLLSTPTHDQHSRIWQAYLDGDQRKFLVPCPECFAYQPLERTRFRYRLDKTPSGRQEKQAEPVEHGAAVDPDGVVIEAYFVCADCGSEIHERSKPWLLAKGRWQPTAAARNPGTHSYHLSGAYSPIGLGLSWRALGQRLHRAQSDDSRLKAVLNTDWAEVWKESGESVDDLALRARRETYDRDELERAGKILRITAWTDVQKDRLEMTVCGWGEGEECWIFDHLILPGDTAQPEVWEDLDAAERAAQVDVSGVDAGYNTSLVLAYVKGRSWRIATKGTPGAWRPLHEDERKRALRLRRQKHRGTGVEPIGIDQGKSIIHARLRQTRVGHGYFHFPADVEEIDAEYFSQLAAEELRQRLRNGRRVLEWVAVRPRNEALDCLVGNLAVCRLAGPLLNLPHKRRLRGFGQAPGSVVPNGVPNDAATVSAGAPSSGFDLSAAISRAIATRRRA